MQKTTTFLSIPIAEATRQLARQFALEQHESEKKQKIYYNTIVVSAVGNYLSWLQIKTNLNQSNLEKLNSRQLFGANVLTISGIGKLECLSVLENETVCIIDSDTVAERIGYMATRLSNSDRELQILGFYPACDPACPPAQVKLSELQSLDKFVDCYNRLEAAIAFLPTEHHWQQLGEKSNLLPIVPQLERIWRTCRPDAWQEEAGKTLSYYCDRNLATTEFLSLGGKILVALDQLWQTTEFGENYL